MDEVANLVKQYFILLSQSILTAQLKHASDVA